MMQELRCALVASLVSACGGDGDVDPIRLGIVSPSSGDLREAGRNQRDAVLLALDEINAAGGVLGRPLGIDARDDGTSLQGVSAAYSELLAEQVPAILGPIFSQGVLAIADQIRAGHTLTVSGGATSPALTALNDNGFFFRTVPSDAVQAIVLADKILAAGCQNVCLVYRSDAYGTGLAEALRARLPAASVKLTDASYDPEAALSNVMTPCEPVRAATRPGVVFVTFEGDGKLILEAAAGRGWTAASHGIFLVDGNRRPELFDALTRRDAFEGAIGTAPSGPDPASDAGRRLRAFQNRFEARYGHLPATNAENHYDSAYVAAIAIELAGATDDGDAIRSAVGRSASGPAVIAGDWAGLRTAIESQHQVDFRGASGEVDLEPISGEPRPPYYVQLWTIERGTIVDREVVTVTAP